MNDVMWVAAIVAGLGCYALKLAGLSLPESFLERADVRRVAMFLPVAMLAALVATEVFDAGGRVALDPRMLAGLGAGVVVLLFRGTFIVVIVVAAATTALLRLIT